MMNTFFDIVKVPAVNGAVIGVTSIDGLTDVLTVFLLLTTLIWTLVKIAKALKDFHGEE